MPLPVHFILSVAPIKLGCHRQPRSGSVFGLRAHNSVYLSHHFDFPVPSSSSLLLGLTSFTYVWLEFPSQCYGSIGRNKFCTVNAVTGSSHTGPFAGKPEPLEVWCFFFSRSASHFLKLVNSVFLVPHCPRGKLIVGFSLPISSSPPRSVRTKALQAANPPPSTANRFGDRPRQFVDPELPFFRT